MAWCFSVKSSYVAPNWGSCMYGRAVDQTSFFWVSRLAVGSTPREASFRLQRGMCWSNWGAYRSAIGGNSSFIYCDFFDKTQLCEKCLLGRSAQCWSNWGAYRSAIGKKSSFDGAIFFTNPDFLRNTPLVKSGQCWSNWSACRSAKKGGEVVFFYAAIFLTNPDFLRNAH